jgi:D-serine/D-alanine/glycine transporter
MTSAASSANSGIYSATRMLFGLAKDGHASDAFALSDKRQVPRNAVFFTCAFAFSAIPLLLAGDSLIEAFTVVSSICSTLVLFTWGMIVISHLRYQRKFPEKHAASAFKLPFAKVTPWLVLAFFVFIVYALFTGEDTRNSLLGTPIWFAILAVLWQVRKRKLISQGRPITGEIPTTTHPLDL